MHDRIPNPQQSFCNHIYCEIKHLEERDFLTFRNETVKFLSGLQHKAEECKRQVTKTQQAQVTTFQLPEATQATVRHEYILTILDTSFNTSCSAKPSSRTTTNNLSKTINSYAVLPKQKIHHPTLTHPPNP